MEKSDEQKVRKCRRARAGGGQPAVTKGWPPLG